MRERLRLLEIGFYVRGGMGVLFSLFFALYVAMFIGVSFIPDEAWTNANRASSAPAAARSADNASPAPVRDSAAPPKVLFRIFGCVFGVITLLLFALAGATAYAGRCLRARRRRLFVQIVAALQCIFVPYGTLLGVFALITLGSPLARLEFESSAG